MSWFSGWLARAWRGPWFGPDEEEVIVVPPVIVPTVGPPVTDMTLQGEAVLMNRLGSVLVGDATGSAMTDAPRPRLTRSRDFVESRGGSGSVIDASPTNLTQPTDLSSGLTVGEVLDSSHCGLADLENYV